MTESVDFESVSGESLRVMRKGVNLRIGIAHDKEKVERLHRHGLGVSGMFMFDNDEDGPDILQRTV